MGASAARKPASADSLHTRLAEAEAEIRRLRKINNDLRTELLQQRHTADTDPLIDVYNRRAFIREIERAQTMMARYDILCCVLFFDLNGFKEINDQYGHAIGDRLLIQTGETLKAHVRECDMVARIGGDEFGVLLFKSDEKVGKAKASVLACRLAEQTLDIGGERVSISTAWGISGTYPDESAEQILHRADREMYLRKAERDEAGQ